MEGINMNRLLLIIFVFVNLSSLSGQSQKELSLQGHRGARGLYPENTIYGLLKTLEIPEVNTLEFDLSVTKDQQIILSHEPWMNEEICYLNASEEENNIYSMSYEMVKQIDCGSKGHPSFPDQEKKFSTKPLLSETLKAIKQYCSEHELELPYLNIELKSRTSWYGVYCPMPDQFTKLVEQVLLKSGYPKEKIIFQSFDSEILIQFRQSELNWTLSYLVDSKIQPNKVIHKLGFKPDIISPNFKFINKNWVDKYHNKGILVIPWTINQVKDMSILLEYGVDGLISDYPNLFSALNN